MQIPYPYRETSPSTSVTPPSDGLALRLHWSAMQLTGPDAQTFLQGQVTCDMRTITAEQGSLGALLNLKGRIVTAFIAVAIDNGYALIMPSDQIALAMARLQKYAVFSKVEITPTTWTINGLLGSHLMPDALAQQHYATLQQGEQRYIRLAGMHRALVIGQPQPDGSTAEHQRWLAHALLSGEFLPSAADTEKWQPQELNYHTLNGVSYEKGCYLGQEIVARLYFRGQLKSHLAVLRFDWPQPMNADTDWPLQLDEQKVGDVVAVAWPQPGQAIALALLRQNTQQCIWQTNAGALLAQVTELVID